MRVCYFGTYEREYPRNSVVINGLKKAEIDVAECHLPLLEKEDKTKLSFLDKLGIILKFPYVYCRLFFRFRKLKKEEDIDCMIVGYIGQFDMFAARLFAKDKKIVFNPMISLYDTLVNDRKLVKNRLLKNLLHWIDKKSCSLADLVLLDTEEHAGYFRKEFGLKNVDVLYVGAEDMFRPMRAKRRKKADGFRVLYYGKFTPLHGTRYVIESAKLLEDHKDIRFEIIGTGQTYKEDMALARRLRIKNIRFTDWVAYKKLPEKIAEADICLGGHFGKGEKAVRVVPNKVFQIIAMGKPVVVNDGPAIREAGFKDGINCLFSKPADADSIANSVLKLRDDQNLMDRIGKGSLELYKNNFSGRSIAKSLIGKIRSLNRKNKKTWGKI